VYQVNNSITFSVKPIESEEFLNQMVEALGIIIDNVLMKRTGDGSLFLFILRNYNTFNVKNLFQIQFN